MAIPRIYTSFSKEEINHVFKTGFRPLRNYALDILVAPQLGAHGRILVIASRKTGNAVQRNTIKRQLKHIFAQEELYTKGFDCIVIVKKDAANLNFQELKDLLLATFNKITKPHAPQ